MTSFLFFKVISKGSNCSKGNNSAKGNNYAAPDCDASDNLLVASKVKEKG